MNKTDFKEHLRKQLSFLKNSCNSYDSGFHEEAIRIATVIRVLLHQTKSSNSLLTHLNATSTNLLSTSVPPSENSIGHIGMGALVLGGGEAKYIPNLNHGPQHKYIPVNDWWNQIIYILQTQTILRRKDIVLTAANKDGGAHIDKSLTPEYEKLAESGSIASFHYYENEKQVLRLTDDAHLIALRQMAYELLNSDELVDLIKN